MKATPNRGVQVPVVQSISSSSGDNNNHLGETKRIFDQPRISESPAPAPVAGGEDEVIRVSAVRKIKVTAPPPPARSNSNSSLDPKRNNHINKNDKMPKKKRNVLYDDEDDDEEEEEEFLESSDEESDFEPMNVVVKSPYEGSSDAEKGEPLFHKMKSVLQEAENKKLNPEAVRIFGQANAWCLVKANALIEKSGMVYSQEWTEGIVRGEKIGAPKELVLLCLVSNRFAKQNDLLLSGLCRDFGVSAMINEALEAWGLAGDYRKIQKVTKNYQFEKRRRDCYKAAIFVARTFGCYKAFGMEGGLESSLKQKVVACLDMMEENLPEQKKKRKSGESVAAKPVAEAAAEATDPPKRKRGRPRKHPLPTPEPKAQPKPNDSALVDDDDEVDYKPSSKKAKRQSASKASTKGALAEKSDEEDDDDQMYPYNRPARVKAKKDGTTTNGTGGMVVTTSLAKLISSFELQYEEMGQVYQKMGQTLTQLKTKIQENRTATEEEIR
eukprot:CAMPEP_0176179638 /NCGR_PEP_ID=MMETSP0120_2-20121206/92039_1 /TAXON_ID=160619 /ORGANISM="Kryptoperidinium foliaceum, Strain CCMP 1326" /LENGTH=496 /DNA_ID=CAMNT_0017517811 /DNA_START=185 /DNA_END=1671 /DNA_ORIENTATION=+